MNKEIYRVIDANANRLMEGLRVVEEVCRFILDNKNLTEKMKSLRIRSKENLIKILNSKDILVGSRDSRKDVGRLMYPKSESDRQNYASIVSSNISRCQEASRVIEEFGKMISPEVGRAFKEIRFSLYDIEKDILEFTQLKKRSDKLNFDLYVVTDPDVLGKKSPVDAVKDAIKGGAKIIQLRDKKASIGQYFKWAKEINSICKKAGVTFIVNDYVDVCLALDADGIHIGQDDMPVDEVRKLIGHDKLIGLSTHSYEQASKGAKSGADYISIGPVFSTQSKPNTVPVGIPLIKRYIKEKNTLPFVAIGGINETNLEFVINAGAKRIAVIRAAIGQKDISRAVRDLRKKWIN